ncbi:MAG: leucine-rich repeat domain-containing protein [archaeon]
MNKRGLTPIIIGIIVVVAIVVVVGGIMIFSGGGCSDGEVKCKNSEEYICQNGEWLLNGESCGVNNNIANDDVAANDDDSGSDLVACSNSEYKTEIYMDYSVSENKVKLTDGSVDKLADNIRDNGNSALDGIKDLDCLNTVVIEPISGLSDISALSSLTNLQQLTITYNDVSDLSPLSNLKSLTFLNLQGNDITDVSPLSGLTELTNLNLVSNSDLADISPLQGLNNLNYLYLQRTLITMDTCQDFKDSHEGVQVGCGESLTGWI